MIYRAAAAAAAGGGLIRVRSSHCCRHYRHPCPCPHPCSCCCCPRCHRDWEVHRQAMTTEEDSQRDRGDNNLCQTMTARHRRQKHPLQWGTAGGGRDTTTAVHRLPSACFNSILAVIFVACYRLALPSPPLSNVIIHHCQLQMPLTGSHPCWSSLFHFYLFLVHFYGVVDSKQFHC